MHILKDNQFCCARRETVLSDSLSQPLIMGLLNWCHTWVGLQQDLSLSVYFLSPVFGAVCTAHQVLKVSVQLSLLRLPQLLLCKLRHSTQTHGSAPDSSCLSSHSFGGKAGESTWRHDVIKGSVHDLLLLDCGFRPPPDTLTLVQMTKSNVTFLYYNLQASLNDSMIHFH